MVLLAGARRAARLIAVLVCLGLVIGWPDTAAAQQKMLFMAVLDEAGQPVLDVRKDEVQLEQGGTTCKIDSMQPEVDGMKVALIVDNSGPAASSLNPLRDGLRVFLTELPDKHAVGLFTIAGYVRQRVDFTTDREPLLESVDNLFVEANTGAVFVDGLLETWKRRFDKDDAWPVFVVVSYDGTETSGGEKDRQFNQMVVDLMGRGAAAHIIIVSGGGAGGIQRNLALNITKNTGSIYNPLAAATGLSNALTELAATMSAHYASAGNQYRVVFECKPDTPGPIKVAVARAGAGVRLAASRRAKP